VSVVGCRMVDIEGAEESVEEMLLKRKCVARYHVPLAALDQDGPHSKVAEVVETVHEIESLVGLERRKQALLLSLRTCDRLLQNPSLHLQSIRHRSRTRKSLAANSVTRNHHHRGSHQRLDYVHLPLLLLACGFHHVLRFHVYCRYRPHRGGMLSKPAILLFVV
jgi:hypothetical protein